MALPLGGVRDEDDLFLPKIIKKKLKILLTVVNDAERIRYILLSI